jgi:hypothetical protein
MINVLPYALLPKLTIIKLKHFCVIWLNSFPVRLRISDKYSPRELVSRHRLDAKLHYKTLFGAYCEIHTDKEVTITIEPRMRWAIFLGPTENLQGISIFILLTAGRKIARRKFTKMLITKSVIKKVKKMASKDRALTGLTNKYVAPISCQLSYHTCDSLVGS